MIVWRLLILMGLAMSAQADFIRVELGGGMMAVQPGGAFTDTKGNFEQTLKDDLDLETENNLYAWAFIQHPLFLVPNLRLEYLSLDHASDKADISFKEFDAILYLNLLDIMMTSLDLGIDVKNIQADFGDRMGAYYLQDSSSKTIGLLYGRARFEPGDLGVELILKATSYGETKGYDARLKADYTLSFIPLIHPGLEVGYRIHKIQYELSDVINKAEYMGVYGGLMLRF